MSTHPHPLPADERDAVERAVRVFRERQRSVESRSSEDLVVSRQDFELIELAFQHFPTWDPETGEPVVQHLVFRDPQESREHVMFKGVHLFHE